MQSLHDLSHLEIIFQKAQSHISMVLFVAQHGEVELTPIDSIRLYAVTFIYNYIIMPHCLDCKSTARP